jgi:hypothetical protein
MNKVNIWLARRCPCRNAARSNPPPLKMDGKRLIPSDPLRIDLDESRCFDSQSRPAMSGSGTSIVDRRGLWVIGNDKPAANGARMFDLQKDAWIGDANGSGFRRICAFEQPLAAFDCRQYRENRGLGRLAQQRRRQKCGGQQKSMSSDVYS